MKRKFFNNLNTSRNILIRFFNYLAIEYQNSFSKFFFIALFENIIFYYFFFNFILF